MAKIKKRDLWCCKTVIAKLLCNATAAIPTCTIYVLIYSLHVHVHQYCVYLVSSITIGQFCILTCKPVFIGSKSLVHACNNPCSQSPLPAFFFGKAGSRDWERDYVAGAGIVFLFVMLVETEHAITVQNNAST